MNSSILVVDTSAAHAPYFDWVVAHVGNSFPQTVVTEVLSLGLQNFSSNPPQVSKISSVVGILGHLVTTHSKEIQFAFEKILEDGICAHNTVVRNFGVPYLLQLCSSSGPLLDVLMDSVLPKGTKFWSHSSNLIYAHVFFPGCDDEAV